MSDELSLTGSLEEATVPELVRGIVRSRDSAVLEIRGEGATSLVCFREGRIVFASTDDPDLGLAEIFLSRGQIGFEQYQESQRKGTGANAGAVLVKLGFVSSDELIRGIEAQVREIIVRVFNRRSGEYVLTFGENFPPGTVALQLPTDRIILDGIAKIDRWSRISGGIRDLDMTVRKATGQDSRFYGLDLTEEENGILSLCESPFTIRELCRMSYLTNFETCRVVWGLLCVNLLEEIRSSSAAEASTGEGAAKVVSEFNAAYTAMYRIVFAQIGEEIQEFVEELVSDLPPEMARMFRGIDLTEGGRVDAARFEANLQAERPANLEAAAQELLNELLYQWIFHVKKRFGAEVERDVTAALNAMKQA